MLKIDMEISIRYMDNSVMSTPIADTQQLKGSLNACLGKL